MKNFINLQRDGKASDCGEIATDSAQCIVNPSNSQLKFIEAVKPLMKYLAENHYPTQMVIVSSTSATMLAGVQEFQTAEFLDDVVVYRNQNGEVIDGKTIVPNESLSEEDIKRAQLGDLQ